MSGVCVALPVRSPTAGRPLADRGTGPRAAVPAGVDLAPCSTRCSTTRARWPRPSPCWSCTAARSSPSATRARSSTSTAPPTPVDGGDALAQLVDGQVGAARGRRPPRRRRPPRPRRAGGGTRVGRPRRPAARHHAAPAAGHARRPRLRGGLRGRPVVRRDRDALRRRPARHGPLRGRRARSPRRRGRGSPTRRAPRTSSRASSPAPSGPARPTPASCTAGSSRRSA